MEGDLELGLEDLHHLPVTAEVELLLQGAGLPLAGQGAFREADFVTLDTGLLHEVVVKLQNTSGNNTVSMFLYARSLQEIVYRLKKDNLSCP